MNYKALKPDIGKNSLLCPRRHTKISNELSRRDKKLKCRQFGCFTVYYLFFIKNTSSSFKWASTFQIFFFCFHFQICIYSKDGMNRIVFMVEYMQWCIKLCNCQYQVRFWHQVRVRQKIAQKVRLLERNKRVLVGILGQVHATTSAPCLFLGPLLPPVYWASEVFRVWANSACLTYFTTI